LHNALEQAGQARCAEVVNLILDNAKTCAPNDAKALTKGVSIRDMKLTMIALDVDCRDCVEKPELIDVCICVLFGVCCNDNTAFSAYCKACANPDCCRVSTRWRKLPTAIQVPKISVLEPNPTMLDLMTLFDFCHTETKKNSTRLKNKNC
jgi:hypothetical protein